MGDAVCESCGVWGLWYKGIASRVVTVLGVTVWGDMLCENQNIPDLPHVGVTVCSGIGVWGLQCLGFAVCESCGMRELWCAGVVVCGSYGVWELRCA